MKNLTMNIKRFFSLWVIVSFILTVAMVGTASADITGTLSPDTITETHDYNEAWTYTLDYCIEITGEATGKADVLFLTDTTGSMFGYIDDINDALSGILAAIDACLPALDIEYGVSDYRNYTDGGNYSAYGANLIQPFTSDTNTVQTAINSMSAGGGADYPESQLKAMVTISDNWLTDSDPNVGFGGRGDAQKILIWAGDVPGHIAGDEPNSSGPPPAGYYPTLDATINALNAQGILVFALNTQDCNWGINQLYGGISIAHEPLRRQADEITSATGGTLFCSVGTGGSSIEDAIVAAITGGVETLSNITLNLDGDDGDFVVDPCTQTIIGSWDACDSPVCGSFDFDATAPGYDGVADFNMVLLGNGAELDRTDVHLNTEQMQVDVDIKPQSCPNPLNTKSQGVLPVAILGSAELDVTTIDVASIRLEGVAPIRSELEDVAAPVVDGSECECTTEGPDGFTDLTLKFEAEDIADALGEVVNGEVLVLTLTGELSDETPIEGADCIRVIKKSKK
jgi:hypothetical protein